MNRTSWLICGVTLAILAVLGLFYLWPVSKSSWQIYNQEKQAQKDLSDASKRKEVLTALSQNNQLTDLFAIASQYIPENANSSDLIIQLSAMASQNSLTVDQVSLEGQNQSSSTSQEQATTNQSSTANTNTSTAKGSASNATAIQEVDFALKVSGSFGDFLNFLKSTETSSRLITIKAMNLTQANGTLTADLKGKAYWKKGTSLENNLANITISQETINKFQNLKSYGSPINLTTESGFGRPDPFAGF